MDSTGAADAAFDRCFLLQKKERKNSNKRIPISSRTTIYQLKRMISSTITKTTLSERPSGKKSAGTSRYGFESAGAPKGLRRVSGPQ